MLTVYKISFRSSLRSVRLSRMKWGSVAGKGPPSRKRFYGARLREGSNAFFQAEEDATIVVAPLQI
jgi:hypothetical protein